MTVLSFRASGTFVNSFVNLHVKCFIELAVACRFAPAFHRALCASHEVTNSSRAFSHKKRPATLSELQICGGRYKTRTCGGLPLRARLRRLSARPSPRSTCFARGHKFEPCFSHKKRPATLSELQICGGRYKTRTCDLPHVKRMRYQLRQSSSSLQARGILHDTAPNVKNFFLNPPFFFTATQKCSFRHKKKQSLFITGSVFLELNAALRLAVDRQHFFNAKGLYRQLAAAAFSQTRNDTLLRILARRQLDH